MKRRRARAATIAAATGVLLVAGTAFQFRSPDNVLLRGNRVSCNINNVGELCVHPNNSPAIGGGFWPARTNDQYIFNQGLQFAGIILGVEQGNYLWPQDTVGAFFFDERGDQAHGEPLTSVFDWLDPRDRAHWPDAARVRDPALFAPSLIGRAAVSRQDTWTRFWDGGTHLTGRTHPAGIVVEQRTLSFDTPDLEDAIFFIYRVINVSARDAAAYQGLSAVGYDAEHIAEIARIGEQFHDAMATRFAVQIPDAGYTIDDAYLAFGQDADVGQAGQNYSNGNLVFQNTMSYRSDFSEPTWRFPLEIFAPPFAARPGFSATALIRGPRDTLSGAPAGIFMVSNHSGGAPFPAPSGVSRMWRNHSLNLLPSDGTCSVGNAAQAKLRHICFMTQTPTDSRIVFSSGPTRLPPGGSLTMVIAQVHAAPLDTVFSTNVVPGFPVEGTRLVSGADTLRTIDRVAGWVSHSDVDGDGRIEPTEVLTQPRSLFWKIQRAQALVAAGFLQPAAPDAPPSHAIPGDNQVTVVWGRSPSENGGDPYFPVASNPVSALYDPDYRANDVEGYRVWRGRSPATMQVIAQFDYAGTSMQDFTGQFQGNANNPGCAPELGLVATCPAFPVTVPLSGNVVQYRLGDRVLLSNGTAAPIRADTAVTGGASGRTALVDSRVPFVFIDSTVRNSETWYYAVTAFDVNSARSGASTMESPVLPQRVVPRVPAVNLARASVVTEVVGGDGTVLDSIGAMPAIDSATGTFTGPIPPSLGAHLELEALAPELLAPGDYAITIDSVSPGSLGGLGLAGNTLYYRFSYPGGSNSASVALPQPGFASFPGARSTTIVRHQFPYDSAAAARSGVRFAGQLTAAFTTEVWNPSWTSPGIGLQAGRYLEANAASRYLSHSRWFDAGGNEPPDPTIDPFASATSNSGRLTGVTSIFKPASYRLPIENEAPYSQAITSRFRSVDLVRTVWYAADFVVTWGVGGAITVRDSTHRTDLPFNQAYGTGYGFTVADSFAALTEANLEAADACTSTCASSVTPSAGTVGYRHLYYHFPANVFRGIARINMSNRAVLGPIDMNTDGVADGNGIALTINSETFFFTMAALPAPGTRWQLRAIGGAGMDAVCTPALAAPLLAKPTDCSGYTFVRPVDPWPPYAPGLTYRLRVTGAFALDPAAAGNLDQVHPVPDPYYLTTSLETSGRQQIRFVNLPDRAIIRIYSTSGVLVAVIAHNDPVGGEAAWDVRSRTGARVASGVYFYHVEAADGATRVGRMTVVNRER